MLSYDGRPYISRQSVAPIVDFDPEKLHLLSKVAALRAAYNNSHYEGYGFGVAFPVLDEDNIIKIVTGANDKPYKGSLRRICAEQAAVLALQSGDRVFGTSYLFSPEPKEIAGSRYTKFTGPCFAVCLPMLYRISPDLQTAMFRVPDLDTLKTAIESDDQGELLALAAACAPGDVRTNEEMFQFQSGRIDTYAELPVGTTFDSLAIAGLQIVFNVHTIPKPRQITAEEISQPVAA